MLLVCYLATTKVVKANSVEFMDHIVKRQVYRVTYIKSCGVLALDTSSIRHSLLGILMITV